MLLGQWSGRYDIPSPSCVVIFGDRVCGKSSCVVEAQGTASGGVFFDNAHTQLLCSERRSSPCVWLRKAPVFAAVEGGKSGVTFKLPSRQRCEDCTREGHFRGDSEAAMPVEKDEAIVRKNCEHQAVGAHPLAWARSHWLPKEISRDWNPHAKHPRYSK